MSEVNLNFGLMWKFKLFGRWVSEGRFTRPLCSCVAPEWLVSVLLKWSYWKHGQSRPLKLLSSPKQGLADLCMPNITMPTYDFYWLSESGDLIMPEQNFNLAYLTHFFFYEAQHFLWHTLKDTVNNSNNQNPLNASTNKPLPTQETLYINSILTCCGLGLDCAFACVRMCLCVLAVEFKLGRRLTDGGMELLCR